ncbi:MAG: pyridoxal-phosphate dependent enzyme [Bacteroidetes bacterium]|nr:pyridoxal-phosphate dependent enzyme [Bacteroidota bacterium]
MFDINLLPSESHSRVDSYSLNTQTLNLFIKRDDLIHPVISGNKWRKLKYNILYAQRNQVEGIITFGGAYSNHLIATALAAKISQLKCVGIVRGEELSYHSNTILSYCTSLGADLTFVSRKEYALRDETIYKQQLLTTYKNYLIIPEGGRNYHGILGCMEIMKETSNDYDYVCVSQGTSTTSVGILLTIPEKTKLIVCPALKGFDSINEMSQAMLTMGFEKEFVRDKLTQVIVLQTDILGKYGKASRELKNFNTELYDRTKINFDITYNAKSLFMLDDFIKKKSLFEDKILYIHTGGFS